jgi:hypothetical protein
MKIDVKFVEAKMAQFVLKSIDAATGCYLEQILFTADDPSVPTGIVGLKTMNEGMSIDLDESQIRELVHALNVRIEYINNPGELHRLGDKSTFDPKSHTGRELLLMLNNKKPFAAFAEVSWGNNVEAIIPEDYFEPHVRKGTILKKEHIQKEGKKIPQKIRRVLYALPGEEWRFNAFIALWELAAVYGWDAGFEKVEGYILGYETTIDPFFARSKETK